MKNKSVFIGNWYYTKPDLIPNKNGDIVIIKRVSFGPLEAYEWGMDVNNTPYELYKWAENDFYEDESYIKNITREELINQILSVILLFEENGLSEWVNIYGKILDGLDFIVFDK